MMDFPAYTIHDAWDRDAVIGWDPVFHTFFIRSAFFTGSASPRSIIFAL